MTIFLIPLIYIAICSGMSAILPEIDYTTISTPAIEQSAKQSEEQK